MFADLNIGAVVVGDELRLLQRGNKRQADNVIVRYSLSQVLNALCNAHAYSIAPSATNRINLGSIEGVPFCFTDAAALSNGHLLSLQQFDRPFKVEGISARGSGDRLDLLLVTDADDPAIPALLLSTSIAK
ncbi:hypothetical protein NOJ28_26595 [Neorhizobium galegae]|nr:hypothetical protein [Neorhizobium galegae]MCQ1769101.1 hypothetical protein [Neorhizobium galegae]MCQ1846266.1 hypothetical protein [Neorhizobium galegae]CDZ38069.1 Hypothetical protein NGAL_HAMBI1146_26860 [Neorhizobium galegae bv. officinalis]